MYGRAGQEQGKVERAFQAVGILKEGEESGDFHSRSAFQFCHAFQEGTKERRNGVTSPLLFHVLWSEAFHPRSSSLERSYAGEEGGGRRRNRTNAGRFLTKVEEEERGMAMMQEFALSHGILRRRI